MEIQDNNKLYSPEEINEKEVLFKSYLQEIKYTIPEFKSKIPLIQKKYYEIFFKKIIQP